MTQDAYCRTYSNTQLVSENVISERTKAGLDAARARGKKGGRPPTLATSKKVQLAKQLFADKTNEIEDIYKTLNISKSTLYRYVAPQTPL